MTDAIPTQSISLAELLPALELSEPIIHGNLAMYPLLSGLDQKPGYLTLDEALEMGRCEVREISESGNVNRLFLVNGSDLPILLLDGDILRGAKQNRVVNFTMLAPDRSEIEVPVSCVEQGRWSYSSRNFRAAEESCYASMRVTKALQMKAASKRGNRVLDADQGAILDEISAKSARMAAYSPSRDIEALYRNRDNELVRMTEVFKAQTTQVGALFVLHGHVLGMDLFDSPRTLTRVLPRIVRGYVLETFDPSLVRAGNGAEQPDEFIARLRHATARRAKASLGLGEQLHIEGNGIGASGLLHEGRVVHLFAYASRDAVREDEA